MKQKVLFPLEDNIIKLYELSTKESPLKGLPQESKLWERLQPRLGML